MEDKVKASVPEEKKDVHYCTGIRASQTDNNCTADGSNWTGKVPETERLIITTHLRYDPLPYFERVRRNSNGT